MTGRGLVERGGWGLIILAALQAGVHMGLHQHAAQLLWMMHATLLWYVKPIR
jgi:hypothetical protein